MLLERLININPAKRPSAAETLKVLDKIRAQKTVVVDKMEFNSGALVPVVAETAWHARPKAVVKAVSS